MKRSFLLLEHLPAGFQPGAGDELYALTPRACQQLDERNIPYRTLPDLGTEEKLRDREGAYFREQLEWFGQMDRMLRQQLPDLKSASSVPPALLYGYTLKTLLDDWFIRGTECAALLDAGAGRVTFHGTAGPYSRLFSLLCGESGIPYEERLLDSAPARPPLYRVLRPIVYALRRWRRMARNWPGSGRSSGAGRLTLLFLETTCDLNDLLDSALQNKHRCLVREGFRIRDLSQGGRLVFSAAGVKSADSSAERIAEELFGHSSSLWNWIRTGWNFPAEKLLAEPLKDWARTELARMLPLADQFRNFYRREGVDFVITPSLVSNPHTAAVAACDPRTKPQAVLIAHGDGAEVKPAWDLFELAPYQHYFVPEREFAEYFEGKRSLYPFPAAQVHVGSYRWRNYTLLRGRKGRPPAPLPSGKPVVVYPVCQSETDIRYLNSLGYSETGSYRLQRQLLKVFAEFPDHTFVLKLFPPATAKTSAIAKALARLGAPNVIVSGVPFSQWLPWADRVLLDWPSTPLHETALAGIPFHLLVSTKECAARFSALEKFKGCYTPFANLEEAAQAVRNFMRNPAPKPVVIRPEGEEILSQLLNMKKDRVYVSSSSSFLKKPVSPFLQGIPWAYLGVQADTRSRLEARLGKTTRLPIETRLQEAADRLRKPFLDFVADIGARQEDLLSWWSSRFSWKMWTSSDLFLLTSYLSLAEDWIKQARSEGRPLLLLVEDPWLLRQLRKNLAREGQLAALVGDNSMGREKLKAVFYGAVRRVLWLGKTLRDFWNQRRVWPNHWSEVPAEPSAAIFSVPVVGGFQPGREWKDPHLPQAGRWLNEEGFRVFRFSPPDYPGYERELAERADYFHPLILWATPAAIWRSLTAAWWPRLPDRLEVAGMNVRKLAEREAWLEAGRASLSSYRLFYECLRNRLAKGNWKWLLFFYENQPWEKLAVLCARERGIRTAGVQTAILSPEYLPYLLGEAEKNMAPLPDVICTSGPYAHRLLADWGNAPQRLKACGALRYAELAGKPASGENGEGSAARSNVLVVLPIYPPMADHLLRALEAAFPDGGASESLHLRIRPHPLYPVTAAQVRIPAEIESSRFGSIQESLWQCGVVLFTGSTVGFEAIHAGKPVLRYRPDILPDIDSVYGPAVPCCGDGDLRKKLLRLVRKGYSAAEWAAARETVGALFSPPEPERFKELFRSQGPTETMVKYTDLT